jgi:hypothetical protein
MGEPAFFKGAHRRGLAEFKYTRWAADLPEEQLKIVLWAVGELGNRSRAILECLGRHESELADGYGYPRARAALQVLWRVVTYREGVSSAEFGKMIADAREEMEREQNGHSAEPGAAADGGHDAGS